MSAANAAGTPPSAARAGSDTGQVRLRSCEQPDGRSEGSESWQRSASRSGGSGGYRTRPRRRSRRRTQTPVPLREWCSRHHHYGSLNGGREGAPMIGRILVAAMLVSLVAFVACGETSLPKPTVTPTAVPTRTPTREPLPPTPAQTPTFPFGGGDVFGIPSKCPANVPIPFPEEKRRRVYLDIVRAQDKADADEIKTGKSYHVLVESYTAKVAVKYQISMKQLNCIGYEGSLNWWPFPPLP